MWERPKRGRRELGEAWKREYGRGMGELHSSPSIEGSLLA